MDSTQAFFHSSDTLCWVDEPKELRSLFVKIETDSLESSEAINGKAMDFQASKLYVRHLLIHNRNVMRQTNNNIRATIICNGRPVLTRRAKYLVKFLKSLVPNNVLAYIECEFCSEARHNQNKMAETIFIILVGSLKPCSIDDSRLSLKVDELAHMLISYIDPFRLSRNE